MPASPPDPPKPVAARPRPRPALGPTPSFSRRLQARYAEIERAKLRRKFVWVGLATAVLLAFFAWSVYSRSSEPARRPVRSGRQHVEGDPDAQQGFYMDEDGDRVAIEVRAKEKVTSILLHHDHLTESEAARHNERLLVGAGLEKISPLAEGSPLIRQLIGDIDIALFLQDSDEELEEYILGHMFQLNERKDGLGPESRVVAANIVAVSQILLERLRNSMFHKEAAFSSGLNASSEQDAFLARRGFRADMAADLFKERELLLLQCIGYDHLVHFLPEVSDRALLINTITQMYRRVYPQQHLRSNQVRRFLMYWTERIIEQAQDFSFEADVKVWFPSILEQIDGAGIPSSDQKFLSDL